MNVGTTEASCEPVEGERRLTTNAERQPVLEEVGNRGVFEIHTYPLLLC